MKIYGLSKVVEKIIVYQELMRPTRFEKFALFAKSCILFEKLLRKYEESGIFSKM
jgi:hypothetical protein